MRVTQLDIAKLAKVSQATVSRVLAGDNRVEQDIQLRVLEVIREYNYKPDVRARSLRKQRTHLIGLVVKRDPHELEGDPFFSLFVASIIDYLSKTPYHLCVDISSDDVGQANVYDELLRTQRVDGLILVESEPSDTRVLRLQEDNFPFVLVGNPGDMGVYSVDNDNVMAGRVATEHLIAGGYRKIGFIAGPENVTVCSDRVQGYLEALAKTGQDPMVWYSDFGLEPALETAREALCSGEMPDALVVLDDFMAMGVYQAAREARIRVPQQLGIVSFNDTNLCHLVEGGLTSVNLNMGALVRRACRRLLKVIEGEEILGDRSITLPCDLKVRGSSLRTPEVSLL